MPMLPLDDHLKASLERYLHELEGVLDADVLAYFGPIVYGLDDGVRQALDALKDRRGHLAVILECPGGVVEVVERIVDTIRHAYDTVTAIVPDRAMSAGTVMALSADRIVMDHYSRLGPIDPQIWRNDRLVPALAFLNQYEKLKEKAQQNQLTTVEFALLQKLDLGELYEFEQARELTIELLVKWLSKYKFGTWTETETRKLAVTAQMKSQRAEEIAALLNDTDRWHSHSRGIGMDTLRSELRLRIDDMDEQPDLASSVRQYHRLLRDYMRRQEISNFVHTRGFF